MEEVIRKMRSNRITGFHRITTEVESQPNLLTGSISITTVDGNEIVVFQAVDPISKDIFSTKFAALETALNETWFVIPNNVDYVA